MTLTVGSLFSGIGGIDLGLERAGMRVLWQCEKDAYCRKVLARHWPDVPCYEDVTAVEWSQVEPVDLICGGYPCQPFSYAGVREGTGDVRHLWPYFANALRVLRPRMALLENVPGHLSLGFDAVLSDLADLGFDAEWSLVPACAMGAPHTRERLFVLAYAQGDDGESDMPCHRTGQVRGVEPRGGSGRTGRGWWLSEPDVGRVAHGVPRNVVNPLLTAVGNAVVPQVAEWIGRRIVSAA